MADGRGGEAAECGGAADDQSGLDESSRGRRRLRTVVRALRVACDRLLLAEEVAGAESSRARFVVETAGATDGAAGFALLAGRGSLVRPAGGPGATFTAVYSPKTSCGWPSDSYGVVARRQVSPERRLDEARWSRLASPALRRPSIARSFRVRKAFHPTNFRPGFRNFAAAMKQPLHCSSAGSTLVEQPSTVAASLFVAAACSSLVLAIFAAAGLRDRDGFRSASAPYSQPRRTHAAAAPQAAVVPPPDRSPLVCPRRRRHHPHPR